MFPSTQQSAFAEKTALAHLAHHLLHSLVLINEQVHLAAKKNALLWCQRVSAGTQSLQYGRACTFCNAQLSGVVPWWKQDSVITFIHGKGHALLDVVLLVFVFSLEL